MKHEHCPTCGQKTTYELSIDTGTAKMMTAISDFVKEKGFVEIRIDQLLKGWSEYWSTNGYEIKEGVVITTNPRLEKFID